MNSRLVENAESEMDNLVEIKFGIPDRWINVQVRLLVDGRQAEEGVVQRRSVADGKSSQDPFLPVRIQELLTIEAQYVIVYLPGRLDHLSSLPVGIPVNKRRG
jgi:hypothetical protein